MEISRINGRKSNGPVTARGKRNSSRNAVKHGLTAHSPVFTNEDRPAFERLHRRYYKRYAPVGEDERGCVDRMVMARWRERRAWMYEAALMDYEMDSQDDLVAGRFDGEFDEPTRAALAFRNLTDETSALLRLQTYEQAALRTYNRALERLLALQSARKNPDFDKTNLPTD